MIRPNHYIIQKKDINNNKNIYDISYTQNIYRYPYHCTQGQIAQNWHVFALWSSKHWGDETSPVWITCLIENKSVIGGFPENSLQIYSGWSHRLMSFADMSDPSSSWDSAAQNLCLQTNQVHPRRPKQQANDGFCGSCQENWVPLDHLANSPNNLKTWVVVSYSPLIERVSTSTIRRIQKECLNH